MPIPTFTQLKPFPEFNDIVNKVNTLVQEMQNLFLTLDSLNVVSLTADNVDTGTLDANLVTIAAEDGSYSYTIDSTGIKANNGSVDTLKFDLATGLLTIVSALIQSASGYPRVELNSASNLIAAYQTALNRIRIIPTSGSGNPAILFDTGGATQGSTELGVSGLSMTTSGSTPLSFQGAGGVNINSTTGSLSLTVGSNFRINGLNGVTGSIPVVTSINFGTSTYTFSVLNFTKGILTSVV